MMGKVSADTDDIVFQKIAHDNDKETKKERFVKDSLQVISSL